MSVLLWLIVNCQADAMNLLLFCVASNVLMNKKAPRITISIVEQKFIHFAITNKKFQSNFGRAASPPLMAENNYATKSPLVTMGRPKFTPENCSFPLGNLQPIIGLQLHPSIDRPHSPPLTASRSN